MGCDPDWREPRLQEARTRVVAAARRNGIAWGGVTGNADDVADMLKLGGRLIALGSDFGAVREMLPTYSRALADGIGRAGLGRAETGTK